MRERERERGILVEERRKYGASEFFNGRERGITTSGVYIKLCLGYKKGSNRTFLLEQVSGGLEPILLYYPLFLSFFLSFFLPNPSFRNTIHSDDPERTEIYAGYPIGRSNPIPVSMISIISITSIRFARRKHRSAKACSLRYVSKPGILQMTMIQIDRFC